MQQFFAFRIAHPQPKGRPRPAAQGVSACLRLETLEDRCLLSAALVRDIVPGTRGSLPGPMAAFGDQLFFGIRTAPNAIWRSDGTEEGTAAIRSLGTFPLTEIKVGDWLYFVDSGPLSPSSRHNHLFRSDGTTEGTVQVDSAIGSSSTFLGRLTVLGDAAYYVKVFGAPSGITSVTLHRVTGSSSPVQLVSGQRLVNNFQNLTVVNDTVFFAASVAAGQGRELWKTDGTPQGTVLVKDINPGAADSMPSQLVNVGGTLYFTADDGVHGRELWASDGTADGTYMVADIRPGPEGSNPQNLIAGFFSYALFSADDGVNGRELWLSPGFQTGGPEMILDINPGPASSDPQSLIDVSGYLFFSANDGAHGRELWFSDWLPEGTYLLKDVNPGPAGSNPEKLTSLDGYWVYFAAEDFTNGRELWVSDWTEEGTALVEDIHPGIANSSPDFLTELNGALFFSAADAAHGRELWRTEPGRGGGPGSGPQPGWPGMDLLSHGLAQSSLPVVQPTRPSSSWLRAGLEVAQAFDRLTAPLRLCAIEENAAVTQASASALCLDVREKQGPGIFSDKATRKRLLASADFPVPLSRREEPVRHAGIPDALEVFRSGEPQVGGPVLHAEHAVQED